MTVRASAIPQHSLLDAYRASGAYTDCYVTEIDAVVTHAQFVEAFYTTRLFKLERFLLAVMLSRPSTDTHARELGEGHRSTFAAWCVESRAENQLLLAAGRTRSWLMVRVRTDDGPVSTQLLFGSAVVPARAPSAAGGGMGFLFTALLGFHRLYSRALLASARRRLLGRHRHDIS